MNNKEIDIKPIESRNELEVRVMNALANGVKGIEADPQTIENSFPGVIGKDKYFIYKGVCIYKAGMMDSTLAEESVQTGVRVHGSSESVMDNR